MSVEQDYYTLLNVDTFANDKELKQAFLKLAKIYHPDKNGGRTTKQFQNINLAYITLTDPDKRYVYDRIYMEKKEEKKQRLNLLFSNFTPCSENSVIYNTASGLGKGCLECIWGCTIVSMGTVAGIVVGIGGFILLATFCKSDNIPLITLLNPFVEGYCIAQRGADLGYSVITHSITCSWESLIYLYKNVNDAWENKRALKHTPVIIEGDEWTMLE